MEHDSEQAQIFYLLKHIDYSQSLNDLNVYLEYDLGDYDFQSTATYSKVKEAATVLWKIFNGFLDSNGNPIK